MRQLAQTLNRSKNVLNVCVDLDLLLPLVVSDSQRLGFSRVQSGALPKKNKCLVVGMCTFTAGWFSVLQKKIFFVAVWESKKGLDSKLSW